MLLNFIEVGISVKCQQWNRNFDTKLIVFSW